MMPFDVGTPHSRRPSAIGTPESHPAPQILVKSPGHPAQRGRKPSRVLYPPLRRKYTLPEKGDPIKRWLLFLLGVLLLQILMEEPVPERQGSGSSQDYAEDQWCETPTDTQSLKNLSNSSRNGTTLRETTPHSLLNRPQERTYFQQTCGIVCSLQKPRRFQITHV
uniref:Uncharacterized protein n=1 Tax=Sphaerodactylus townsendi TaxID=933632 RepID=A0ACB8EZQ2_9SAUR